MVSWYQLIKMSSMKPGSMQKVKVERWEGKKGCEHEQLSKMAGLFFHNVGCMYDQEQVYIFGCFNR